MSYPRETMPESQEDEQVGENLHRKYLIQRYLDGINKVQSGELTPEQFAEQQTDREIELENRADHDGLTEILNYQGFVDAVTQDLAIIKQFDIPAHLGFIDGDFVGQVNKDRGKLEANRLIQTYARVLTQTTRNHPNLPMIIGRFGGDEFAILIIGGQKKDVQQVLEEILNVIPQAAKETYNDPNFKNTVSIGAVTLHPNDTTMTFLDRADQNLDVAKKTRNIIVFDHPVPPRQTPAK